MIHRRSLYFMLLCRRDIMLTDAFRAIGRREEACFAAVDSTVTAGAANVEHVRDSRAVDALGALFRLVEERVRRHTPPT